MSRISEIIEALQSIESVLDGVMSLLDRPRLWKHNGVGYRLTCARELVEYFRDSLPFKEGDRVRVRQDITASLDPEGGWYSSRKTLEVGATGTVKFIEFCPAFPDFKPPRSAGVAYYVVFDKEYWWSSYDKEWRKNPDGDRHVWGLGARYLELESAPEKIGVEHTPESPTDPCSPPSGPPSSGALGTRS